MIWRERRILLIVLAALLAANTIFFFTYRVRYENRLSDLNARLNQANGRFDQAHDARITAQLQLAAYRKAERDVQLIYVDMWSTQNARLTRLIGEVKRLALASQLVPQTYSFTREETKPLPGSRAAAPPATVVGISFAVQGTYQQVRNLINRLELSDQFVIIDSIGLSSASSGNLSLNLHLKTLFRDMPAAPASAGQNL